MLLSFKTQREEKFHLQLLISSWNFFSFLQRREEATAKKEIVHKTQIKESKARRIKNKLERNEKVEANAPGQLILNIFSFFYFLELEVSLSHF